MRIKGVILNSALFTVPVTNDAGERIGTINISRTDEGVEFEGGVHPREYAAEIEACGEYSQGRECPHGDDHQDIDWGCS